MVVGRSYRGRETPCVLWRRFVPYLLARTSPLTTKTGIYGRVLGSPMLMLLVRLRFAWHENPSLKFSSFLTFSFFVRGKISSTSLLRFATECGIAMGGVEIYREELFTRQMLEVVEIVRAMRRKSFLHANYVKSR